MTDLRRWARAGLALSVMFAATMLSSVAAQAFPTKLSANGQLDFTYGSAVQSAGGPATGYKPESKLFYTGDGISEAVRWWAVLGTSGPSPAAGDWLFQLDQNHAWNPVLQLPSADPWAKADTLFDGSTLFVSTRDVKSASGGNPRESDLYEIPYLGNATWGTVTGPFAITTASVETLTIAKDSTGRLWATFEQGRNIKVGYTTPNGTSFTFITVSQSKVNSDDVSAVVAFGGKIGVYWSDQVAKKDFFAWHLDSDPPASNWTIETAYGGGVGGCPTANSDLCADDHLNVKVSNGEVYVAIKTSLNNATGAPNDPLIALLRRSTSGTWAAFPVSTVGQDATRPITVLSPAQNAIWVWAARNGEIDVWESAFTSPGFTSSAFIVWTKGSGSFDDPTATKQVTTAASGTVVEASIASQNQYWHNEFLATGGPPAGPTISGFSPTSGCVGASVAISGTGFTGATAVTFSNTPAASFNVNSDSSITATVPSGATSGPISVTANGQTATSSSNFTPLASPSISGFNPTSGPVGSSVSIAGCGLTGASSVTFFNNVAATSFTVNSDTSITATVPSGASTGPISVTVGGSTATSATNFTVSTGGGSAITEVQKKHAGTSGTSISATLGAPPAPGNVLVAVVAVAASSNVIFDTPAGWTQAFTPNRGDVFYKVSDGSEQTVTVNLTAGQSSTTLRMWVVELSGVATSNPFDQGNSAIFTSQTTSVTPTTSASTAQANEWAIAMVAHNGDNGTSTGGAAATDGFTLLGTGNTRDIAASKVLGTAGTVSTTISWVTPRAGSWIIATFRAA